jgi:hypothetical protein
VPRVGEEREVLLRPEPAHDGQLKVHSDVCDVTGYDAAEFFGELMLELKAHVGRAAERVGQLVQDGPGEVREGLELAALDDDPAFCWFPDAHGFLVAAFHQAHGLGGEYVCHVPGSSSSGREDTRQRLPDRSFGAAEVGRIDEGEAEAVLPLVAVAVQVAYGVAEGVAQAGELPADGLSTLAAYLGAATGLPATVGGRAVLDVLNDDRML